MPRDVFPRADDRAAIAAFLDGTLEGEVLTETLVVIPRFVAIGGLGSTLWFDTAGALVAQLPVAGLFQRTAVRLIDAVCEILDAPDRKLVQEVHENEAVAIENPGRFVVRYSANGEIVPYGQPFVLMGPLGMHAYRASRKNTPNGATAP